MRLNEIYSEEWDDKKDKTIQKIALKKKSLFFKNVDKINKTLTRLIKKKKKKKERREKICNYKYRE